MYFKSDNRKIIIGNNTEEITEKLFQSLLHQISNRLKGINERQ